MPDLADDDPRYKPNSKVRSTKQLDKLMSEDRRYAPGELESLQNERAKSSAVEHDTATAKHNTHLILRKYRPD